MKMRAHFNALRALVCAVVNFLRARPGRSPRTHERAKGGLGLTRTRLHYTEGITKGEASVIMDAFFKSKKGG